MPDHKVVRFLGRSQKTTTSSQTAIHPLGNGNQLFAFGKKILWETRSGHASSQQSQSISFAKSGQAQTIEMVPRLAVQPSQVMKTTCTALNLPGIVGKP